MFKSKLKYEFRRIVALKTSLFLGLIFVISLFTVISGIIEYHRIIKNLEVDILGEAKKAKSFTTYDQAGSIGFRLLFRPSPLSVFFPVTGVIKNLESNIDTTEVVRIHSDVKGNEILKSRGNFKDFGSILYIWGSFFMMVMGLLTFKSKKYLFNTDKKFLLTVFCRLILLNGYFVLLLAISLLTAIMGGIVFSHTDLLLYTFFSVITLLFHDFAFLSGVFFSLRHKRSLNGAFTGLTLWAFILFFLPGLSYFDIAPYKIPSSREIDFKKIKRLLITEKEIRKIILPLINKNELTEADIRLKQKTLVDNYMGGVFIENKRMEVELQKGIKRLIGKYEMLGAFFPWSFYSILQENISGKGYEAYTGFVDHVLEIRDGFCRFIISRRYVSPPLKVEPYVKEGENVFASQGRIQESGLLGVFVLLAWILCTGFFSYRLFKRKLYSGQNEKPAGLPDFLKQSRTYFLYCKDRERYFHYLDYFVNLDDCGVIENNTEDVFESGIHPAYRIEHIAETERLDSKEILNYLRQLDIEEMDLNRKLPNYDNTFYKKVYLALLLAKHKPLYVIFDFFKGETRSFELQCKKLLSEIQSQFLYISTERMEYIADSGKFNPHESQMIGVDWFNERITLR